MKINFQKRIQFDGIREDLVDCFKKGWDDFLGTVEPERRAVLSLRTRASLVSDFVKHRVKEKFEGTNEIEFGNPNELFCVILKQDGMIVRFKKLDNSLNPSNIPTQQQALFYSNEQFDGWDCYRAVVGYQLNEEQTMIESIVVLYYESGLKVHHEYLYKQDQEHQNSLWENMAIQQPGRDSGKDLPVIKPRKATKEAIA